MQNALHSYICGDISVCYFVEIHGEEMNILFFLIPKSEVAHIHDHNTVRQTLEVMEFHKYACIPIISKDGKYMGSITEGDLLWGLKSCEVFTLKEAEDIPIMSINRRLDYKPVKADSNMKDLVTRAMDQNYVPVVDDQDNFIGLITRKDIIGYCYENLKDE